MLLQTARHTFFQVPIVKYEQKRNAEYIEFRSQILVGIDIYFANAYFAFGFDPKLVDNRCHGTAARSPGSPGKHENRKGGF